MPSMLRKLAYPTILTLVALASIALGTTFSTGRLLSSGAGTAACSGDSCGRVYLKSTAASYPSSVIRWRDSSDTNRWSMGNDVAAANAQDFWIYDNVNSAYTLLSSRTGTGVNSSYLRFGATDGRMTYDNTAHTWDFATNGVARMTLSDTGLTTASGITLSENSVRVLANVGTGLSKATNTVSLNLAGASCSAGQFMTALGATGTGTCSATSINGTTNTIPKYSGANAIGNSTLTDDGTTLSVNTNKVQIVESTGATTIASSLKAVTLLGNGAPTASTCGTGPTIATGSTNNMGAVTTGTGATGCIITWASPGYPNAPFCLVWTPSTTTFTNNPTTSTTQLGSWTASASTTYRWLCGGG